jgi:ferrous iron transport protein A
MSRQGNQNCLSSASSSLNCCIACSAKDVIGTPISGWSLRQDWESLLALQMNVEFQNTENAAPEARCEECPLSLARTGVAVRILRLCAAPDIQDRLRELGLCEDQVIRLITNRTNFICQVCNARLALSEQLARLIVVEPVLKTAVAWC